MTLADCWSKWILPALKILASIAVAIFAVFTAREIVRLIRQSREGQVNGAGQPFKASPEDPSIILVETPLGTEPVQLPPGITAPDVRAVVVVPAKPATVEVLNAVKDRRTVAPALRPGVD
jgi:hypothetical protein